MFPALQPPCRGTLRFPRWGRRGISYRSTQQVIDAFTAFAKDMGASKDMLALALPPDCGIGPEGLDLRKFDRDENEEEGIAAAIQELVEDYSNSTISKPFIRGRCRNVVQNRRLENTECIPWERNFSLWI
jgi:hypothetical protein